MKFPLTQTEINNPFTGDEVKSSTERSLADETPDPRSVNFRNYPSFAKFSVKVIAEDLGRIYGANPYGVSKILAARGVVQAFNIRRHLFKMEADMRGNLSLNCEFLRKHKISKKEKRNTPNVVKQYYRILGYMDAIRDAKFGIKSAIKSNQLKVDAKSLDMVGVPTVKAMMTLAELNALQD